MARKYLPISTFFAALIAVATGSPAAAEVACVVDVSYRWVREQALPAGGVMPPTEQPKPKDSKPATAAPAAGAAGVATPPEGTKGAVQEVIPGEQQVRFASIERRGKDERSVKAGLLVEVNRQKARAHERCKQDHEGFGDCVSTKLAAKTSTLNSLSFSARSKVEEALIEECRVQQGRCVAIDAGEPVCRDLSGAVPTPGASGAAAESGKGPGTEGQGAATKAPESAADKAKSAKKKP